MSRAQIGIVAFRAVAIWLIATAAAEAAGFVLMWVSSQDQRFLVGLVFVAVVAPLAGGILAWVIAPTIAARMFRRDQPGQMVTTPDFYRIASAFSGLLLLGQSLPGVALIFSAWLMSMTAHTSVLGSTGLGDGERSALINVQTKAGMVALLARILIGALLLAKPESIEQTIRRLRREAVATEPDVDSDDSQDGDSGHEGDVRRG